MPHVLITQATSGKVVIIGPFVSEYFARKYGDLMLGGADYIAVPLQKPRNMP